MKLYYTERFRESYPMLSEALKAQTDKAVGFLLRNLRHPSLRAKKYDEARGIWQARISKTHRLYFLIEGDAYVLLDVTPHPK